MVDKKLIPNSTQIPNIILDFLAPRLSEAEARCLVYISRRTYGFHKEEDRISLSQFVDGVKDKNKEVLDYGSGLSRPSVVEALKNLSRADLIIIKRDTKGNYYKINLDLFGDKGWRGKTGQVVKEVNRLRKLTYIGKAALPISVKLLNPQKKGNKGNKEEGSSFKKLKPFFRGMEMRKSKGKWYCLPNDGSAWLEFAGTEKDIKYR